MTPIPTELRQLLSEQPACCCDHFSHDTKQDQHGALDECPPANRHIAALAACEEALADWEKTSCGK